jgi:hypothetical protein
MLASKLSVPIVTHDLFNVETGGEVLQLNNDYLLVRLSVGRSTFEIETAAQRGERTLTQEPIHTRA